MGTPAVSPLKTQNALSSAVGLREGASDKRKEGRKKDNSDLQCIVCWKIPVGLKPRKQTMHPGGNRRILSNIMCTSDLAK